MKECPRDKLLKARTISEAKKVLETIKATPAQYKLTEIAFANPQSRDVLLDSVIQEDLGIARTADKTPGEKDIDKKTQEEQLKTARDSDGSSDSTEPYPGEGSDAPDSDIEGMQKASGENQMKEGFGMPPMGGQMGGGMPGMMPIAPDLMKQMGPPQMPPGITPQMMRQMQYTIEAYTKPLFAEIKNLREAVLAVDKKVKETHSVSMPLNIPNGNSWFKANVQETSNEFLDYANAKTRLTPKAQQLDQVRNKISELDKNLSQSPYN